jgi:predicted DNA-binding protein (MmcQ/YjbR family)
MLDHNQLKTYMLSKPETLLDFPFGADVSVFKVKGKMFALISEKDGFTILNLKCEPDQGIILRDIFPAITPGYHMNKKHWISIYFDPERPIPTGEVERLIDQSFMLVVAKMTKRDRTSIQLQL